MAAEVVIVDYGSGNVRSMYNALKQAVRDGQEVVLSTERTAIEQAERLVLPGVGAFGECRKLLDDSGLLPAITAKVQGGTPFLGICVGMQILADQGLEFQPHPGLGWIPGVCRKLDPGPGAKLPHIGWSPVDFKPHALFDGLPPRPYLYFVHSFFLEAKDPAHVAATATYGETFTAAVAKGNVFGCQFHPEKSDRLGKKLLQNFCRWSP